MSQIYFYAQGIESATVSASSSDTNYPVSNIQLRSRRNYWMSNQTTDQYLEINFGVSSAPDFLYIDKSNFATLYADGITNIALQHYDGGVWSDVLNVTIAYTNDPQIVSIDPTDSLEVTGRYRLYFNDDGTNTTKPIIYFILMGESISDNRFHPDFGATNIKRNAGLVIHESINGNKSSVRISQVDSNKTRGYFDRTFKILTDSEFNELDRIYTDTNEMLYPFAMTDYDGTLRFVRIDTESYLEQMRYNIRNSTTLTFIQEF